MNIRAQLKILMGETHNHTSYKLKENIIIVSLPASATSSDFSTRVNFKGTNSHVFFIYSLFLSDEGPMLETLDYTIRIDSTPTFLYFDLYLYSAYADSAYNTVPMCACTHVSLFI